MSKSNTFENDWLKLIFNAVAIPLIADNAATTPLTGLFVSLHTADPGEAGDQTTSETAYTGYLRVAVARTTAGWTVTANSVSPASEVLFGPCTALPGGNITHVCVGTAATGPGSVLYRATMTPNISMAVTVAPRISVSSTITEE